MGQRSYDLPAPDHLHYQAMPNAKPLPTQERLQARFTYSPVTGQLFHLKGRFKGQPAGYKALNGYLMVGGEHLYAHRVIWKLVTGEDPVGLEVDHIDGDRTNNAWHNLRLATSANNGHNRGRQSNNKSGFKGVSLHVQGRWVARIKANGTHQHIGLYDTPEEAHAAYLAAAERLHGEFARAS